MNNKLNYVAWAVVVILSILCIQFAYKLHKANESLKNIPVIEKYDEDNGLYTKIYEDKEFVQLKNENRELYDSLKAYKNEIDYLAQFKYSKSYSTGKVVVEKPQVVVVESTDSVAKPIQTYMYGNNANDSLQYNLQIGAKEEPDWYKLDITVNDKLTLVNKHNGTKNETNIQSTNQAVISETTIYHKPAKKKFWDRFAVGPTVSVGYDPIHNNVGTTVGIGVTFNLLK